MQCVISLQTVSHGLHFRVVIWKKILRKTMARNTTRNADGFSRYCKYFPGGLRARAKAREGGSKSAISGFQRGVHAEAEHKI